MICPDFAIFSLELTDDDAEVQSSNSGVRAHESQS
jgi:hypothetical protein